MFPLSLSWSQPYPGSAQGRFTFIQKAQHSPLGLLIFLHPITSSGCAILFAAFQPVVIPLSFLCQHQHCCKEKNPWSHSPLNLALCFCSALSLECLSSVSSQHTWRPRCVKCEGVCVSAPCMPAHFLLLRNASPLCYWNNCGERFCFPTCSFIS